MKKSLLSFLSIILCFIVICFFSSAGCDKIETNEEETGMCGKAIHDSIYWSVHTFDNATLVQYYRIK